MHKNTVKIYILLTLSIFSSLASAEPWVDTSNIFLRADLQLMADKGHLNIPLTTYPLMWADVSRGLKGINNASLDEESKNAFWHIQQQMRRSKKSKKSFSMNIATEDKRFTSFGDEYRDANTVSSDMSFMGERFAGKLSFSAAADPDDGDDVRLDNSYLAFFLGNWVFSAGAYDRWWGPGFDSSLALSNNARPMPSLALTRKTSEPFVMPFFNEIKIPWTVTTFMAQMEEERHVPNTLLWGFRANFKFTSKLEFGLSRTGQWAGDGRPSSFDTFVDLLLGRDNCAEESFGCGEGRFNEEPGNQMAGYDLRYSRLFDSSISIYYQIHAEDGTIDSTSFIAKKVTMYGVDSRINFLDNNWLAFIEYADTYLDCTNANTGVANGIGDCLYEHTIYESGMRYKQKNIAHLYENDSESIVIGLISQMNNLESWEFKLRILDLNNDNSDLYPDDPNKGNTLTKIAEEMIMVSGKYQLRVGRFKYTVGGALSTSSFEEDIDDKVEPSMYFNVELML
ncbi:capsule assembly Wzi family protein [Colwelliaceae bacterium BS250]